VVMNTISVGTPLQNINFPGNSNGGTGQAILKETFSKPGTLRFVLNKVNKLAKLEFLC